MRLGGDRVGVGWGEVGLAEKEGGVWKNMNFFLFKIYYFIILII